MRIAWLMVAGVFLVVTSLAGAQAQEAPPSPSTELLASLNNVSKKLIDMAEDFPGEKYGYRPTPEVRSFADHLRHLAGVNYFFLRVARGEAAGAEDLPAEQFKTKAEIAAVLKKSFEEVAAAIQQGGDEGLRKTLQHPFADPHGGGHETITQLGLWMMLVENAGEHYGSLVVYYRLNGIVPPVSRRRMP
jgi:uncharacterized damage-inducible protein DinB